MSANGSDYNQTVFRRAVWPAAVGALFIAGLPVRLLMEVWSPLGYLFWVLGPVVFLGLVKVLSRDMTPALCPQCRRRLRNGQTRCHKCAQFVEAV